MPLLSVSKKFVKQNGMTLFLCANMSYDLGEKSKQNTQKFS